MQIRILTADTLPAQITIVRVALFAGHMVATVAFFDRNTAGGARGGMVFEVSVGLLFFEVFAYHGFEGFAAEFLLHNRPLGGCGWEREVLTHERGLEGDGAGGRAVPRA